VLILERGGLQCCWPSVEYLTVSVLIFQHQACGIVDPVRSAARLPLALMILCEKYCYVSETVRVGVTSIVITLSGSIFRLEVLTLVNNARI